MTSSNSNAISWLLDISRYSSYNKKSLQTNYHTYLIEKGGDVMVIIVRELDLQLPMQSLPITSKVVSSNPIHGEMYSIQHYVIKFVSDLRQVGGFLRVLRFPQLTKLTATI
jgi:hypothetical protein